MLIEKPEQKGSSYKINLVSLEGDGSLPCPKCGMIISPEDKTLENYRIIDTKVVKNELAELVVSCGKCGSVIILAGFQQRVRPKFLFQRI